jgi:hypothetical protein
MVCAARDMCCGVGLKSIRMPRSAAFKAYHCFVGRGTGQGEGSSLCCGSATVADQLVTHWWDYSVMTHVKLLVLFDVD